MFSAWCCGASEGQHSVWCHWHSISDPIAREAHQRLVISGNSLAVALKNSVEEQVVGSESSALDIIDT